MASIDIPNRTYSAYYKKSTHWKEMELAYRGGDAYKHYFLLQYYNESEAAFQDRKERAFYLNYCKTIVNTIISYIFSQEENIHIDLPSAIDYLKEDADSYGSRLLDFMRKNLTDALYLGQYGLLWDTPAQDPDNPDISAADQESKNRRYNLVPVHPANVLNWNTNPDTNKLNWILVKESYQKQDTPFDEPKTIDRYKLWYTDRVEIYKSVENGSILLIATKPNPYGQVPFTWLMPTDFDRDGFGESLIEDLNDINVCIFNLSTLLNRSTMESLFPKLLVPEAQLEEWTDKISDFRQKVKHNPELAETDVADFDKVMDEMLMGVGSIMPYSPDVSGDTIAKPEYLEQSTVVVDAILKITDMLRIEILRISGLNTPGKLEQTGEVSGLSKMVDFIDVNNTLSDIARTTAQQFENHFKILTDVIGGSEDVKFQFPTDFNIASTDKLIANLLLWRGDIDNAEYQEKVERLVIKKSLGRFYPMKDIEKIIDSTESGDSTDTENIEDAAEE